MKRPLLFITLVLMMLFHSHHGALQAKDVNVKVNFETSMGDFTILLLTDKAPLTVKNFLKYIDEGHYRGGQFIRTVRYDNDNGSPKIEVIQGKAKEGIQLFSPIPLETTKATGILHTDGIISMARDTPDSAQDQFFITIGDQPSLNFGGMRNKDGLGFAAFGQVTDGMDVVKAINAIKETKESDDAYTKGQYLLHPVDIIKIIRIDGS